MAKPPAKQGTHTKARVFGLARHEWVFFLKFAALFAIPYFFIHFVDLGPLTASIAGAESVFLSAAGTPARAVGSTVLAAGREFEIVADCTGLVMIIMLAALLWSTPVRRERRWLFLAAGAPFLFVFNLLRLFFTLWVGAALGGLAGEAVHVALWFVDAAVVIALWAKAAEVF
ncbi:MAG: exosortase/archaeosortase family protein [Candidatus Micrarchaeota archaeon]|nr:exosortase/archaeosortase family protein [Candidatus Micrarchaeota archaeon]